MSYSKEINSPYYLLKQVKELGKLPDALYLYTMGRINLPEIEDLDNFNYLQSIDDNLKMISVILWV